MKASQEYASAGPAGDDDRRDRYRKKDAEREEPIRSWWNFFRPAEPGGQAPPRAAGDGKKLNDVVDRGVKLGYQVIEDQIRQGQRLAEEINNRSYGTESMNRDFQELAIRSMRYYVDAASLFMDFVSTLPGMVLPLRPFGPPANGAAAAGSNGQTSGGPAPAAAPRVATRVTSSRPATVTVDLESVDLGRSLSVPGLFAAEKGKPPLTDIAFLSTTDDGRLVLGVEVPDGQPAGLYSGVIFDAESGEPRGTVTVRIES